MQNCVVKPNLNYMWFARLVGPTGGVCVSVLSVLCFNLCSVLHWPFPPTGWSKSLTHGCMSEQNRKLSLSSKRSCLSWTWLRTICFQTERSDTPINSQSFKKMRKSGELWVEEVWAQYCLIGDFIITKGIKRVSV